MISYCHVKFKLQKNAGYVHAHPKNVRFHGDVVFSKPWILLSRTTIFEGSISQDASDAQLRETLRRSHGSPCSPAALRRELKGLVEEKRARSLVQPMENLSKSMGNNGFLMSFNGI